MRSTTHRASRWVLAQESTGQANPISQSNDNGASHAEIDSLINNIDHLTLAPVESKPLCDVVEDTKNKLSPAVKRTQEVRPRHGSGASEQPRSWGTYREDARKSKILFRIFDPASSESCPSKGFRATYMDKAHLLSIQRVGPDPPKGAKPLDPFSGIDVHNKWIERITRFDTGNADEPSRWISMTADLDWAFWDMANRFEYQGLEDIEISVIRHPSKHPDSRMFAYQPSSRLIRASRTYDDSAKRAWHFTNPASEWLALYVIPPGEIIGTIKISRYEGCTKAIMNMPISEC
ncbi:hypothetical protein IAU59_003827 [Kwoniella sp. CBS 9459]